MGWMDGWDGPQRHSQYIFSLSSVFKLYSEKATAGGVMPHLGGFFHGKGKVEMGMEIAWNRLPQNLQERKELWM